MGTFNAGTLNGDPVTFRTTVHGPVIGYATVKGREVAISYKRSSYGKDVLDQLFFRRLSTGQVDDPQSFFNAASLTPQTFNSFYIDSKHVAEFTSGRLPVRPQDVDPGPAHGWDRAVRVAGLPEQGPAHPRHRSRRRDDDQLEQHLRPRLRRGGRQLGRQRLGCARGHVGPEPGRIQNSQGKWSLASVASAMNGAATQDVRAIDTVPLLAAC